MSIHEDEPEVTEAEVVAYFAAQAAGVTGPGWLVLEAAGADDISPRLQREVLYQAAMERAQAGLCSHGGHGWDGETCDEIPDVCP